MPAPQPNAEQCADGALSSASDESVASDGCEDVSDSVTTNNSKEDATAAFNDYYKHQAISDDAAALFAKRLPIAVRVNNSSPCAALCTAALTMRPAPVAGTYFVDAASELLAAFQEVGALARQELVSCVPPALLAAKPGDVVADLCAAPGMKALQLLDAVGPGGLVVASEVDRKRLAVLVRRARRSSSKGAFLALCADARRFPGCDLCGNQISGAPRHGTLTHWLISTKACGGGPDGNKSTAGCCATCRVRATARDARSGASSGPGTCGTAWACTRCSWLF